VSGRSGLALAGRLLAGAALAYSGYVKLMAPAEELALAVESYRLLPTAAALAFARVLPWAELFAGASLLAGCFTRAGAAAAAALFALFLGALASAAARGLALDDCGCFGAGGPRLTRPQAMALDAALLGAALLAFLDRKPRFSLDALFDGK
jgi:uncharacterized membrane protein YphA (DoxX/SURF4 family)